MKAPIRTDQEFIDLGNRFQDRNRDAVRKMKNLAKSGDFSAIGWLANAYWEGDGVKSSKRRSIAYYAQLAELGDADSAQFLSGMYHKGDGVRKNKKKADYYLKLVAKGKYSERPGLIESAKKVLNKKDEAEAEGVVNHPLDRTSQAQSGQG